MAYSAPPPLQKQLRIIFLGYKTVDDYYIMAANDEAILFLIIE